MEEKNRVDVAVIGGGPGGYVAAIRATQLGQSVVLFERDQLGGTCLNRGCIPTKTLLHCAEVYAEVKDCVRFGVSCDNPAYRYAAFAARRDDVAGRLRKGVGALLKKNGVAVVGSAASLCPDGGIEADGRRWLAKNTILATGSYPAAIPIPGIDLPGVINSDGALALNELPSSVVIVGGGVIGIEFATLFANLDKDVSVIEMLPGIMGPAMDPDVSDAMLRVLKRRGVRVHTSAKVLGIRDGLEVAFEARGKQETEKGELVVIATGRRPCTEGLGLEHLGVEMERGFVKVDAHLRTSVPNLYAVGDLTGKIQLAHVASAQGMCAAANTAGRQTTMDYSIVPSCIYTSPEVACVGRTEQQAKEQGYQVETGKFATGGNGRCMSMGETNGFVKMVADAGTGEILGAQIFAPRATDMIAEVAAAMRAEATIEELADTIHPHPTVSEAVMEAASDVLGRSCHKM